MLFVEPEQAVDLILIEDPRLFTGARGDFAFGFGFISLANHGLPFGGEIVLFVLTFTAAFALGGHGLLFGFVCGTGHDISLSCLNGAPIGLAFP